MDCGGFPEDEPRTAVGGPPGGSGAEDSGYDKSQGKSLSRNKNRYVE